MENRKKNDNATRKPKDKRPTINFWKEVIQGETPPLFINIRKKTFFNKTRLCLEIFGYLIKIGIQSWEHQNGTIAPVSEVELKDRLIYLLPIIYEQTNLVRNRTASFTNLRTNSWFKRDRRLKRILAAMEKENYIYERDKGGNTIGFALRKHGSSNLHNLIDSTDNPQRELTENEEDSVIDKILDRLELFRKHGPTQRKIMDMLLDEINVGEEEAETLGVEIKQVATLVHQARLNTCKIAAEEDQKLAEKMDLFKNYRMKKVSKKILVELTLFLFITSADKKIEKFLPLLIFVLSTNRVKKSAQNENEKINQVNSEDEAKKHGPIREWTPENGWITIPYEDALKLKKKRLCRTKQALANPEDQIKMLVSPLD